MATAQRTATRLISCKNRWWPLKKEGSNHSPRVSNTHALTILHQPTCHPRCPLIKMKWVSCNFFKQGISATQCSSTRIHGSSPLGLSDVRIVTSLLSVAIFCHYWSLASVSLATTTNNFTKSTKLVRRTNTYILQETHPCPSYHNGKNWQLYQSELAVFSSNNNQNIILTCQMKKKITR